MKLGDMLAGTKGEHDPKDEPAGVTLTVGLSIGLLEAVDDMVTQTAKTDRPLTRERALLALAAGGAAGAKLVTGLFGLIKRVNEAPGPNHADALRDLAALRHIHTFVSGVCACGERDHG